MNSQTPTQLLAEIKAATALSDTAMAKRLDISQPTVHRILHGKSDCKSSTLLAILKLHAEIMTEQAAA